MFQRILSLQCINANFFRGKGKARRTEIIIEKSADNIVDFDEEQNFA